MFGRFSTVIRPALSASKILIRPAQPSKHQPSQTLRLLKPVQQTSSSFSTTHSHRATYQQVLRGCRKPQPLRKKRSPKLVNRPQIRGVCLRVFTTKPKKPNSGERKTCRVRLSTGIHVSAYIPGEGHNIQQHSVVLLRGGRSQDCPGVRYKCVRGADDLVSYTSFAGRLIRNSMS